MAAWTLPSRIADWIHLLSTGLDRRSRKYLPAVVLGMVLSSGRRTVSSWLRAAGVSDDWQDHYYFLQTLGRGAGHVATRLLFLAVKQIPVSHVGPYVKLAIDDSPTKRYGPKVELAGIHHNPTPGPSGSEYLYGHVWVTISWLVDHPLWGCIGLPLRALMYARQKDLQALENVDRAPWAFRTKLELAAELVEWCVILFQNWFDRPVMVIADGAYAKRPFLRRVMQSGAIAVSRLRKDAALYDLPEPVKARCKGRPRIYGQNRLSLSRRGGHGHGWTQTRLAARDRANGHLQDIPCDVSTGRWNDSRCDREAIGAVVRRQSGRLGGVLQHRHRRECGDSDRECGRPFGHRTELSRRQRSPRIRTTASPQHLVQCGLLEPVSVAAYSGGTVVMASFRHDTQTARRPTMGRTLAETESRGSTQNPEKTRVARIIFCAPRVQRTKRKIQALFNALTRLAT